MKKVRLFQALSVLLACVILLLGWQLVQLNSLSRDAFVQDYVRTYVNLSSANFMLDAIIEQEAITPQQIDQLRLALMYNIFDSKLFFSLIAPRSVTREHFYDISHYLLIIKNRNPGVETIPLSDAQLETLKLYSNAIKFVIEGLPLISEDFSQAKENIRALEREMASRHFFYSAP